MPRLREPGSFLPTLLLVFSGYLLLAGRGTTEEQEDAPFGKLMTPIPPV